ncbi:MAG: tRNA 2-selenouridine(34) synthase MnmH [Lunatimonas sp.]|uniref:tRNA 2-selenouridine(34) synthase MnmH n=1 Tax=Lunatimonas sp. TaxID=2060141 RepID=UPI00263B6563|nr:tRNA 2-selenouridine(34) synthase MnmH [Lunatimonas sp.]MCC5936130.1 tRNA 2-selenouridine(34) synthase MnmH [Lunatimonas sp.]
MLLKLDIGDSFTRNLPIIDVRSPGEFEKGHIPGAYNIPLFSDRERAHVGTVYKKQSQEAAISLGYTYVTPKLDEFISGAFEVAPQGKVIVHCWRGGMRSQAFGEHLAANGFHEVNLVHGGYKAYRNWVLNSFEVPRKIHLLGGYTGSGKTFILRELQKNGEQVIDLEGLARHKGSAFGGIGQDDQPSVEQFENNLSFELSKLDLDRPIWVEDESHNIGNVKIPRAFFNQMRTAGLIFMQIPIEERVHHLVEGYASSGDATLREGILRISKRLGGLRTKEMLGFLDRKDYYHVALMALEYYDNYYLKGLQKREGGNTLYIHLETTAHRENALKILKLTNNGRH